MVSKFDARDQLRLSTDFDPHRHIHFQPCVTSRLRPEIFYFLNIAKFILGQDLCGIQFRSKILRAQWFLR